MQISTNYHIPSNINSVRYNPKFRAINIQEMPPEKIMKYTALSCGSIIASAILLINRSLKDNSNPATELYAKMQDPKFMLANKELAHFEPFGVHADYFNFMPSANDVYSPEMTQRIVNAALRLVQIPEFANYYDKKIDNQEFKKLEITPQNIEIVEMFLNNDKLFNDKNLRKYFGFILSLINRSESQKDISESLMQKAKEAMTECLQDANLLDINIGSYVCNKMGYNA